MQEAHVHPGSTRRADQPAGAGRVPGDAGDGLLEVRQPVPQPRARGRRDGHQQLLHLQV